MGWSKSKYGQNQISVPMVKCGSQKAKEFLRIASGKRCGILIYGLTVENIKKHKSIQIEIEFNKNQALFVKDAEQLQLLSQHEKLYQNSKNHGDVLLIIKPKADKL